MGEPIASWLSLSWPRRASIAPSAHFLINRRAREAEGRVQGPKVKELGEIRENKNKEEENKAEALPNHDYDQSLCHFSLRVLRLSFD